MGQFLRFLHYLMILFLEEGLLMAGNYPTGNAKHGERFFDRQTYVSLLKLIQSLILVTPY